MARPMMMMMTTTATRMQMMRRHIPLFTSSLTRMVTPTTHATGLSRMINVLARFLPFHRQPMLLTNRNRSSSCSRCRRNVANANLGSASSLLRQRTVPRTATQPSSVASPSASSSVHRPAEIARGSCPSSSPTSSIGSVPPSSVSLPPLPRVGLDLNSSRYAERPSWRPCGIVSAPPPSFEPGPGRRNSSPAPIAGRTAASPPITSRLRGMP
mmetsp:Transcript_18177/g.39361  ORF Transcript_18177/g.39361 Transcript_18177/m.39361 type:complete len:212 (-) Transcript_18177:81-716(-)